MSIANLTTFGFGSYGSVNKAVVLGYLADQTTSSNLSIGGPFEEKVRKNNYDRPYLAEHREKLDKLLDSADEETFLILM